MFGYNDLDLAAGRVIVIIDPPDAASAELVERFAANAHQHPGVMLTQSGDYRPHLLSDLMTTQELHRLATRRWYRPVGSKDQIHFNLAPPAAVTIAINRSGEASHSGSDQLYLSPATVRKHLENNYARLAVQSRIEAVAIATRQRPA